jgi:adenosyl cobinamide kinase/adenosyl cobinamide phosphate guanylyltransferase
MIHPETELAFISNEVGYGVVVKTLFPADAIVGVQD